MSILTQTSPDVLAANDVRSIAQQQFNQLRSAGLRGYNAIWNNRNATPQEIIAALGTDAAAIFQLANLNIATLTSAATIAGVDVPSMPTVPADYTVTLNQDGSVTVTQSQSSSSSSSSSSS